MEIWIRDQLTAGLAALILGVLFGILYDVFRIVHVFIGARDVKYTDKMDEVSGHREEKSLFIKIFVFISDLIISIIFTISFAVVTYAFSFGKFRMFVLLCCIAGFAAYISTVGRIVMMLSGIIVEYIRRAAGFVFRLIAYPVKWICRIAAAATMFLWKNTVGFASEKFMYKKRMNYMKKLLKNELPVSVRFD